MLLSLSLIPVPTIPSRIKDDEPPYPSSKNELLEGRKSSLYLSALLKFTLDLVEKKKLISLYGASHSFKINEDDSWFLETNCYGFAHYLLKFFFLNAYNEIVYYMRKMAPEVPLSIDGIPCPFHYAQAFKKPLQYWKRVEDIREIRSGDLMVYMPPGYILPKTYDKSRRTTGTHVMFVKSLENIEKDGFLKVDIIDCTRTPHSSEYDSRWKGRGSAGGIGRASVFIQPHKESGALEHVFLRWSKRGKVYEKFLFIGRLK